MRNLSYENEFCMQFYSHANQSHFHKNGFALRLALKQRHEGTRKWPISLQCDANFIVDNDARNYMIHRTYLQIETLPRNVRLQKLSPWYKVKQLMTKLQKFMYKMGILKGHNTICCPQKFEHDPF